MNLTIIGNGSVGSVLGKKLAEANHKIIFGVRDLNNIKNKSDNDNISYLSISEALSINHVIMICIPAHLTFEFAKEHVDLSDKFILDTTNSVFRKPEPYNNAFDVFRNFSKAKVAKVFNSTGVENMRNPKYNDLSGNQVSADMFIAGSNNEAVDIATTLASDVGFNPLYFGGDEKVTALEDLCKVWIMYSAQIANRNFAFKVMER